MKARLLFTPDATATGGTSATMVSDKTIKSLIPSNASNLWDMADRVCTHWGTVPALVCFWKTQAAFAQNIEDLGLIIGKRNAAGSQVGTKTVSLKILDTKADKGIAKIKLYLEDKLNGKKAAAPQFGRYGIVKYGSTYKLPVDREIRLKNLELVLAALLQDGFGSKEFGTAYFTQLQTDYTAALKQSKSTKEAVSGAVGTKDVLVAETKKVLRALLKLLEGNYPDTFNSVLLEWGFRRGKGFYSCEGQ